MSDTSSDHISILKQCLTEQKALNRALQEKLADRERETDHQQAHPGSRAEKVSRRNAQRDADLNLPQKVSDNLTLRRTAEPKQ